MNGFRKNPEKTVAYSIRNYHPKYRGWEKSGKRTIM
jgi:hypothetical protein